jgi:hypothetical protein
MADQLRERHAGVRDADRHLAPYLSTQLGPASDVMPQDKHAVREEARSIPRSVLRTRRRAWRPTPAPGSGPNGLDEEAPCLAPITIR